LNRTDLQQLAEDRVIDAKALLDAGRWSGAYYLAGYAVECALKSCVLHHLEKTGMIFRDRKYLKDLGECWTHELDKLVGLAGLTAELGMACRANPVLLGYWGTAKDWRETSRYEQTTQTKAEELYEAITNDPDGVLRWIRIHW
jgi:HEPN domain-containing protein